MPLLSYPLAREALFLRYLKKNRTVRTYMQYPRAARILSCMSTIASRRTCFTNSSKRLSWRSASDTIGDALHRHALGGAIRLATALLLAAAAVSFGGAVSAAEGFPSKAVRVVVPYPPGGFNDQLARTLAHHLAKVWGTPVVVDNRPGGSTIIGTESVAKSPADGHTLLIASFAFVANVALYPKLPFDAMRDFAPVILAAQSANVLVANPTLPAQSVKDLISLAKAKPGEINYASGGNGSSTHLCMEMFKSSSGVDLVHVPYKGSAPAVMDLISGQVGVLFDNMPNVLQQVKAGKIRALAVTTAKRSPLLPDVPTVADTLPGFDVTVWFGVTVPAATPRPIVDQLNSEMNRVLALKEVQAQFNAQGVDIVGGSPEKFGAYLQQQIDQWTKVVRSARIKAE